MIYGKLNNTFTRFLAVGVLNTMVGLSAIFILLHWFGWGYWVSTCLGNGIGAVVSYLLNRKFTFRSSSSIGTSFWKFIAVILVCYFFSYWLSRFLAQTLLSGSSLDIAGATVDNLAVLAGTVIYTLINYAGHKYFTFRS